MKTRKLEFEHLGSRVLLAADVVQLNPDLDVPIASEIRGGEIPTVVQRMGDLDRDGVVDASDIDRLGAAINNSSRNLRFDLDNNGRVDRADMDTLVHEILKTEYGDANLDGIVDGQDFLAMRNFMFCDGFGWSSGDFNADGFVDGQDLLVWSQNQGFVHQPGDFSRDGVVDASDIDRLGAAIHGGSSYPVFDLDGNGAVNHADMDTLIHGILKTEYGDANLDRIVDGQDFLAMRNFMFREGFGWSSGDFNSDGFVDGQDFLVWSQHRGFVYQPGDFNRDGVVDAGDIDRLGDAIRALRHDVAFDLDGNGTVDRDDMEMLINRVLKTEYGDANLDGIVDSQDFLAIRDSLFAAGSGWSSGDFNSDGFVDGQDLLIWQHNQVL